MLLYLCVFIVVVVFGVVVLVFITLGVKILEVTRETTKKNIIMYEEQEIWKDFFDWRAARCVETHVEPDI